MILRDTFAGRRDEAVALLKRSGIETRQIVAGNFTRQKTLRYIEHSICRSLDNSDNLHDNGYFVGNNYISITGWIDYLKKTLEVVH